MTLQDENNRLSGLESRVTATNTRSYSVIVRFLKLILPLTAIGLILMLFLWPQLTSVPIEPLNEKDVEALQRSERENRLLNPVFSTQDEKGRPVQVTANEAVQYKDNDRVINLKTPKATLHQNDDSISSLTASNGIYDRISKTIILNEDIVISGQNGMNLQTERLVADLKTGDAQSEGEAILTTKQGTIIGQKIIIERNGAKTIFEGPAKAVMNK
jgi:lipopolysaccharide export system protein LptC